MQPFSPVSVIDQFVEHLREAILKGELGGAMPGVRYLANMHGVGSNTVIAAVAQLEREGFLLSQGAGKRSIITLPDGVKPRGMRVAILLYEQSDALRSYIVELRHALSEAGHPAHICSRNLLDMKMDLNRVKRMVAQEEADAWVIFAGTREILDWFAKHPVHAFAYGGRRRSVNIAGAGPDKLIGQKVLVERLIALGHRRIVLLSREERRKPTPGLFEKTFLERLEMHGIPTGPYNLPDWEDSAEGLCKCLDRCFGVTPPTAIFVDEMHIFLAAQQHLAQKGILAPRDVSLICGDPDPAFDWCRPSVAHISWDSRVLIRRILRWANEIALGKDNRRQLATKSTFVCGGTIGPAPTGKTEPRQRSGLP
jgi:DNA-binding LacI/PurR family transcriptional regulator